MKIEFSSRTAHFTLPKQWASMRAAKELELKNNAPIVHLEKGDYQGAEFKLPSHITDAAKKAIATGDIRYDPGPGIPELREAIANEMEERGRPTTPNEVIITAGAKQSLQISLLSMLSDGDEVIFPNPGYPPDEIWAKYAGAKIKYTPLETDNWQYNINKLSSSISDKTKCLIINTPQRPNGELVGDLDNISNIARKNDKMIVISDEIFSHITYDKNRHRSISSCEGMKERTIVIDTFSKTYAMTGWRIGWTVAPEDIAQKFSMFLQDSITNVATFIQAAAYAALTGPQDWVEEKRILLQKKRDLIVKELNMLPGIQCESPGGSFYVFADIKQTNYSSEEFSNELLKKFNVATVPGTAFGSQGEGYIRLTFAVPDDDIEKGVNGIRKMLK